MHSSHCSDTTVQSLSTRFFTLVNPSLPNEWEVDDALKGLDNLNTEQIDAVLAGEKRVFVSAR